MTAKLKETINFNSVLLLIVLALSTWTLRKVSEMGEQAAASGVRVENLGKAVEALDQRVRTNTTDINGLYRRQP